MWTVVVGCGGIIASVFIVLAQMKPLSTAYDISAVQTQQTSGETTVYLLLVGVVTGLLLMMIRTRGVVESRRVSRVPIVVVILLTVSILAVRLFVYVDQTMAVNRSEREDEEEVRRIRKDALCADPRVSETSREMLQCP